MCSSAEWVMGRARGFWENLGEEAKTVVEKYENLNVARDTALCQNTKESLQVLRSHEESSARGFY